MIQGVNHTGLTVANMKRALAFYQGLLGLQIDPKRTNHHKGEMVAHIIGSEDSDMEVVMLNAGPNARIQLEEYKIPQGVPMSNRWPDPGSSHICLEVDDVHALRDQLEAAGVPILSFDRKPVSLGPTSANPGGWMMGVQDPDGHIVEFLQVPKKG